MWWISSNNWIGFPFIQIAYTPLRFFSTQTLSERIIPNENNAESEKTGVKRALKLPVDNMFFPLVVQRLQPV